MQSFLVDRLYEKTRLDQFLVERLMVFSRNEIQDFIQRGYALVNGKKAKASYQLRWKDRIEVDDEKKVAPRKEHSKKANTLLEPRVVDETQQYFVIEKPAGWMMHQATGNDMAPLISDFVLDLDPTLSVVGDKPSLRPGIVHRLDREVSGLVVVARTQSFFDHIKQQFIKKAVFKTYQALVFGHPVKDEDTIDFNIDRSRRKAKMAAVPKDKPRGKDALTHFEVLERFQHTTFLKVWVKTGRTNQIRAHLAAYSLPIIGDTVYGDRSKANLGVGRVMLHADYITFFDLGGEKKEYSSALPKSFQALVDKGRQYMRKS